MKTLVAILMGVALVAICLPASAEVLSDSQLGEIYAGDGEITGSGFFVDAEIAQSNIGAIVAFKGGEVKSSYISNSNYADVNNY